MPEISVIMPVYKVEQYLRVCIDSVLRQNFVDYELILVDDGSPDRCGEICDSYALLDNRIKVVHQNNQGVSAARNIGIETAAGKYITFIDSDDVVSDDFLRVLYELLIKEKADVSCCSFRHFSEVYEFEKADTGTQVFSLSGKEAAIDALEQNTKREKPKVTIFAWGKLFNKRLFDDIRFPVGRLCQDQAVIPIILSRTSKVTGCGNALYGYRDTEGSIVRSPFTLKRYDGIAAMDDCLRYFKQIKDEELAEAANKRRMWLLAYYSFEARRAGIYNTVPAEYRLSRWKAIQYMRRVLPYELYSYKIVKEYPVFIVGAYIRKVRTVISEKFCKKLRR